MTGVDIKRQMTIDKLKAEVLSLEKENTELRKFGERATRDSASFERQVKTEKQSHEKTWGELMACSAKLAEATEKLDVIRGVLA